MMPTSLKITCVFFVLFVLTMRFEWLAATCVALAYACINAFIKLWR